MHPLCSCSLEAEDVYHFFMRYQNFSNQRDVLFDDLNSVNSDILKMIENVVVQILLSGNKSFSKDMNYRIITSSIRFIRYRKKFDESPFSWEKSFWYIFTTRIKITKYLLWRAIKFSFCVCIVLYIYLYFFKFSIVCRCVCYDE